MTPVMYLDPSGEFLIELLTVSMIVMIVFAAYSTSDKLQDYVDSLIEMGQDGIVMDLSFTLGFFQVGYAVVLNLEDKYVECYPHVGINYGSLINIDFGVIANYEKPGDYSGQFMSISASYWGGFGHSWTTEIESLDFYVDDQAKAYFVTFSPPGINFGYSYYIYNEDNPIIISWG